MIYKLTKEIPASKLRTLIFVMIDPTTATIPNVDIIKEFSESQKYRKNIF